MRKARGFAALAIICAIVMLGVGARKAQGQEKKVPEKKFSYMGVKKCKGCHMTSKSGKQYQKWMAGPHVKAYEELASEQSKEVAAKLGLKEDPQKSAKCLVCHVTAYGVDKELVAETLKIENGVGCESCHGPGSEYYKLSVMKKLAAGTVKPEDVGYVLADEKLCLTCHNKKSPTYKPFKFEEDVKKVAHPTPPKKK